MKINLKYLLVPVYLISNISTGMDQLLEQSILSENIISQNSSFYSTEQLSNEEESYISEDIISQNGSFHSTEQLSNAEESYISEDIISQNSSFHSAEQSSNAEESYISEDIISQNSSFHSAEQSSNEEHNIDQINLDEYKFYCNEKSVSDKELIHLEIQYYIKCSVTNYKNKSNSNQYNKANQNIKRDKNTAMEFIRDISYYVSKLLKNNNMDDLIKYYYSDDSNKAFIEKCDKIFYLLSNLSYTHLNWEILKNFEIYNCEHCNPKKRHNYICNTCICNKCIEYYSNFLKNIRMCYNNKYINRSEYESLLQYLLYLNTFHLMRDELDDKCFEMTKCRPYFKKDNSNIIMELNKPISKTKNINLNLKRTITEEKERPLSNIFFSKNNYKKYFPNNYYSKYKKAYETKKEIIKQIMDELVNISIPNNMPLIWLNKVIKNIESKILPFIIQGFRDIAYIYNYEDKKYERMPSKYDEIFNIDNDLFCRKLDMEFDIHGTIIKNNNYKKYVSTQNNIKNFLGI